MIAAGGYLHETVGEDMELVVRHAPPWRASRGARDRVVFVPDPVAWTEVPGDGCASSAASATAGTAGSPTSCGGTAAALQPALRRAWAWSSFPYFLLVELLAPVVEIVGVVAVVLGLVARRRQRPSSRCCS